MSHELESYEGNVNFHPWWQGMAGTENLARYPDADFATKVLREGIFGWKARLAPVFYRQGGDHEGVLRDVPSVRTVIRDDSGETLDVAVGKGYALVQPSDLCDFADALAATGEARIHTAGVLRGGRRLWVLAETDQFVAVGEEMKRFMLFWNTLDGTSAFTGKLTDTVVCCSNTAEYALNGSGARVFSIRHSGDMEEKLAAARAALTMAHETVGETVKVAERLNSIALSRAEFKAFVCQFLTDVDEPEEAMKAVADSKGRTRSNYEAKGGELVRLYDEGKGAEQRDETAWRAFNTVTEFIDWQRGRMGNYRKLQSTLTPKGADSAMFGDGARKKQRALRLLTRAA